MKKYIQTHERVSVPAHIESKMKLWRMGVVGLPVEYVDFHEQLAQDDLPKFAEANGFRVIEVELVNDGWGDGMKFISAIVEDSCGVYRIKWSDSQAWYMKGAGWSLM